MRPPLVLESIWYLPVRVARSDGGDNLARVLLGAQTAQRRSDLAEREDPVHDRCY